VTEQRLLLPNLSRTQPNRAPPKGRMTKPAADMPKAARSEAVGLPVGKKCAPICWAKKPNSTKSYPSSTLPATPAMTTLRTARGGCAPGAACTRGRED
jgi:hypothetical protein